MQGTLVTWKPDKGFGFIRPDDGGKDVFVHLRDFGSVARAPRVGDIIRFQRVSDGTGRYRAADVEVVGLPRKPTTTSRSGRSGRSAAGSTQLHTAPWRWLVAAGFMVILVVLALRTALPVMVLPVYLAASLAALLLYAFDKAHAMNGRWRTPEATLLLVGLLGGWPGALIAQGMFRHKSRKVAFLVPFWLSVIANCAFLVWTCGNDGASVIHRLID